MFYVSQLLFFMNPPKSQFNSIGAAVKTLKGEDKIENTVQQLISQHPLISSVKDLALPRGMLDFGTPATPDRLTKQDDLARKTKP